MHTHTYTYCTIIMCVCKYMYMYICIYIPLGRLGKQEVAVYVTPSWVVDLIKTSHISLTYLLTIFRNTFTIT